MDEIPYDPGADEDLYGYDVAVDAGGQGGQGGTQSLTQSPLESAGEVAPAVTNGSSNVASTPTIKRKLEDDSDYAVKRARTTPPTSAPRHPKALSGAIWQNIFAFLPPLDLCSAMRVNKLFYSCLTSEPLDYDGADEGPGGIDSNDIWRQARSNYLVGLPEPLEDIPEKRMLDLVINSFCENCGRRAHSTVQPGNIWNAGPGSDGVRVIWHFHARLCGGCFEQLTAKDVELLVTADKVLLPGLSFVFRTNTQHYVAPSLVKAHRASIPPQTQLFKVYHRPSLGKLRQVLHGLRTVSADTANTWLQGLRSMGERKLEDALRWVTWEASLPPGQTAARFVREVCYKTTLRGRNGGRSIHHTSTFEPSITTIPRPVTHPLPARVQTQSTDTSSAEHGVFSRGNLAKSSLSTPQPELSQAEHAERAKIRAKEAKAMQVQRKAEIERRSYLEFEPPLQAQVLQHMRAYNTAILLGRPLEDSEWQHLKLMFTAERLQAERREAERLSNMNSGAYVDSITQRVNRRAGPGEAAGGDPGRERQQKPVRRKLNSIATEIIRDRWAGASKILKIDIPNFAADVIVTTIDRFVEQTDESDFEMGHDVTLETVKHLFDNRIKDHTDAQNCKELFLCAECENTEKWYTFDGMLQHFGAKHEPDFGLGNVVVAWHSALWPRDPPFRAHPLMSRRVPPAYVEAAVKRQAAMTTANATPEIATPSPNASGVQSGRGSPQATSIPIPVASFLAALRQPALSQSRPLGSPPEDIDDDYDPPQQYQTPPAIPEPSKAIAKITKDASRPASRKPEPPRHDHVSDNPFLKDFYAPPKSAGVGPREEVAHASKEIFEKTAGIPDLADSIRLQTIIYHAGARYLARFDKPMSLDVFSETLSTRSEMKSIKKWSGLICKACVEIAKDAELDITPEMLKASDKKWSLTPLLAHFKKVHTPKDNGSSGFLQDMVELPDHDALAAVPLLPGMTDIKLQLIAAALPAGLLSIPQTSIENAAPVQAPSEAALAALLGSLVSGSNLGDAANTTPKSSKSMPDHLKNNARFRDDMTDTEMSMPEAGEDEYDPRRPLIPGPSSNDRNRVSAISTISQTKKSPRSKAPARSKPRQREARAEVIPDVIRTEYDPSRDTSMSPSPPRNMRRSPVLRQRQLSASWRKHNKGSRNSGQRDRAPSEQVRPASPPRYFDQYGREVQLPSYFSQAPQPIETIPAAAPAHAPYVPPPAQASPAAPFTFTPAMLQAFQQHQQNMNAAGIAHSTQHAYPGQAQPQQPINPFAALAGLVASPAPQVQQQYQPPAQYMQHNQPGCGVAQAGYGHGAGQVSSAPHHQGYTARNASGSQYVWESDG